MTLRLAILCPGQGAQHVGMFEVLRNDPRIAKVLDRWSLDIRLGMPMNDMLREPALFTNALAQPLIVAATLAAWEGLKDSLPVPALVAGYSIGELAAYGVTGALTASDAIDLAIARAQAMDRAVIGKPRQALIAIAGLRKEQVDALVASHALYVAIETCDDGLIAGCLSENLPHIEEQVHRFGGQSRLLRVALASHTPLLQDAVATFATALRAARIADPRSPVLSGISAEPVFYREQARTHLARQVAQTIRWAQCMDACAEAGIGVALELGPGATLSRMLRARHPHIACRSVSDFRSLDGIAAWVERALDCAP